jgi:hypothetical protein
LDTLSTSTEVFNWADKVVKPEKNWEETFTLVSLESTSSKNATPFLSSVK